MSDTDSTTNPTEATAAAQPESPKPTPPAAQPTEQASPSGTDWEAEAKKWEKRSKDNFAEAQKVPQLSQRLSDLESKLNEAQHAATESMTNAYREAAVTFAGISEDDAKTFLTGGDKDTLAKQAARLQEMFAQPQPQAGHVPGEGRTPEALALNSSGLEEALKSKLGII